jgi:hypothetical protein
LGSEQHADAATSDLAPLWAFTKWAGKVIATAALGGITGAFAVFQTWTTLQHDVNAHGLSIRQHTQEIQALQQADTNFALVQASIAATTAAEREANKEQLKQIREDLVFMQRELIGRIRRP